MQTLPYGSWPSPISIDLAVGSSRGLSEPRQDGDDIYFLESRPDEAGRVALLRRRPDGAVTDMAPELNVRTRVHEYGGGAYAVSDGVIVFSEFDDNRLMLKRAPGDDAVELVGRPGAALRRHGDRRSSATGSSPSSRTNTSRPSRHATCSSRSRSRDGTIIELATGHDFYSDPVLSPDGRHLALLTWDFPQMPWDGTDLWVAAIAADGTLGEPVHVAGGTEESVIQPKWAPDGSLLYVSDRSDWWNLYRCARGGQWPAESRRWTRRSAVRSGSSACPSTTSTTTAPSTPSPAGPGGSQPAGFGPGPASTRGLLRRERPRLPARPRWRPHGHRRIAHAADGAGAPRPRLGCGGAAARDEHARRRRGLPLDAAAHRVPDLRRPHRLRLVLPAQRTPTSRPRTASCHRWW